VKKRNKIVLFIFKVISAYLNRLKSCWIQPEKASKGTAFSSAVTFPLRASASWHLFPLRRVFTFGKRKCNQENWDFLDKTGWSPGITRVSFVSGHPWVSVRTFFCKSSWMFWRILSSLMFNSTSIVLRAHRRPRVTISRTLSIVSTFREVDWRAFFDHPEELHFRH
jgi:hypothetical protein